mmetsp:Transcript_12281/g.30008  ORF Transcript_12281/g.30008 Transcript_12281/m.30008 type:complete len:433 (-) Transcript_12281:995-2293(-)
MPAPRPWHAGRSLLQWVPSKTKVPLCTSSNLLPLPCCTSLPSRSTCLALHQASLFRLGQLTLTTTFRQRDQPSCCLQRLGANNLPVACHTVTSHARCCTWLTRNLPTCHTPYQQPPAPNGNCCLCCSHACCSHATNLQQSSCTAIHTGDASLLPAPCSSVALDVAVDGAHKGGRRQVAHRAAHQAQAQAQHRGVAKVEAGLEEARHLGLEHKVVDGVEEHVERGGARHAERRPLPVIVFGVEQEVGAHDGDARGDDEQDAHHQQHEAVHVVDLVVPEGREDEVHLDEDGAKGQQPARRCDDRGPQVPLAVGHGRRDALHPAGPVGRRVPVAADDRADEAQREGDEGPQQDDGHDVAKGHGGQRLVADGDGVKDKRDAKAQAREEARGEQHGADPGAAVVGGVEGAAHVAAHARGERVAHDERGEDGAALLEE